MSKSEEGLFVDSSAWGYAYKASKTADLANLANPAPFIRMRAHTHT